MSWYKDSYRHHLAALKHKKKALELSARQTEMLMKMQSLERKTAKMEAKRNKHIEMATEEEAEGEETPEEDI